MTGDHAERRPRMIGEIRVPVPPPVHITPPDEIPAFASSEYLVVEEWTDGTIRHPTTGVVASRELWDRDRTTAIHLLRTRGR